MTRKQRATRVKHRREEQKRHRRTRIEDHGRHQIEVPAGPKPTKGYHRTDPLKHGEALRQAEQIVTFCDHIGFKPTDEQIEVLRSFMREGRLTESVVERMANPLYRLIDGQLVRVDEDFSQESEVEILSSTPEHHGGPQTPRLHVDEVELMTHEELEQDAWDQAAYEQRMGYPTPARWTELEAAAKRKRRGAKGFIKVLEDAGFTLGRGENPKERTSWTRS